MTRAEGVCPLPNKSAVPPSRRWFGWGLDMEGRRRRCERCPFPGNVPLWSTTPPRAAGGGEGPTHRTWGHHEWVWPHLGGSRCCPWKFLPLPAPCSGRMRSGYNPPTSLKRCWDPAWCFALFTQWDLKVLQKTGPHSQLPPCPGQAGSPWHTSHLASPTWPCRATFGKPSWCPLRSNCKAAC